MDRGNAHIFKYLREGKGEGTLFTEGGQYSLVNIVRGGDGGGGTKFTMTTVQGRKKAYVLDTYRGSTWQLA